MKTYSGLITELKPNQIFVFGSNTQGRHNKGTALIARQKFGAIYGQSKGLQGQSYAIVTKDLTKRIHPSVSALDIIFQIGILYTYATLHPNLEFLIAYNTTGANLNGYSSEEMASLFASNLIPHHNKIPDNIVFEEGFAKLVQKIRNLLKTT